MGTAKVTLLGEELTIKGEASQEELERLASDLEAMLRKVMSEANLRGQPTRAALLVALNLNEELAALRVKYGKIRQEYDGILNQWVRKIDRDMEKIEGEGEET